MSGIKTLRGLTLALVILLTAACSGLAGEPKIISTVPPRATAEDVTALIRAADTATGARIFAESCVRCHGAAGKGDGEFVQSGQVGAIPDFTDPATTQKYTPEAWYGVIRDGRIEKLMPPWGESLSGAEIAAVAMYTYRLSGQNNQAATPATPGSVAPLSTEAVTAPVEPTALPLIAGTVHGVVTNGTSGLPHTGEGLEATLYVMNSEAEGRSVPVINGEFSFADVTLAHGDAYVVAVLYNGMQFMSEATTPTAGATALDIPLTIYDVTTDPAAIEIVLLLTEIQRQGNGLLVTQIAQFENRTQTAFMREAALSDGQKVSVELRLPAGARPVTADMQPQYVFDSAENTIFDTNPVLPDVRHTMHIAYTLPFTDSASVTFSVAYRMNNQAELMLPPGGFTVTGSQFVQQGIQEFASGTYDDYLAAPVDAGETLHFELQRPADPLNVNIPLAIGLSLAGIGLMTLSAVMYIHSNRMLRLQPTNQSQQIETLAKSIAELDARHEQGKINERKYRQQRDALKKQLAALVGHQPPDNSH